MGRQTEGDPRNSGGGVCAHANNVYKSAQGERFYVRPRLGASVVSWAQAVGGGGIRSGKRGNLQSIAAVSPGCQILPDLAIFSTARSSARTDSGRSGVD